MWSLGGYVIFYLRAQSPKGRRGGARNEGIKGSKGGGAGQCMS